MADDQTPDHTEDPRKQGTTSGGYPESQHEDATDDDAADTGDDAGDVDAPSPSTPKEADRGASTGNPDAAG